MVYAFDVDGTLVKSFMRDAGGGAIQEYDLVEALPGRKEKIAGLMLRPATAGFALVTNQGGVAFGFQTEAQVYRKLGLVLAEFRFFHGARVSVHVALNHPNAKNPGYRYDDPRRKPGPGMLQEVKVEHATEDLIYIGDMDSDRLAAKAAGVEYIDQKEFFS